MIRNSFIFLQGVTQNKENSIWDQGIHNWQHFLDKENIRGISHYKKPFYNRQINQARQSLLNYDSQYFKSVMKDTEAWRLYNYFKDDVCYLDIETTGFRGSITVIGLYNGRDTKMFVQDRNLNKRDLQEELSKYKLLVTFNGAAFDLPVINRYFNIDFNVPHIDLRFVFGRLGIKGGLKAIEKEMGIARDDDVSGFTGLDAVRLWKKYKATGDCEYLNLLVKYNEEDIVNLKPLTEMAIEKLWKNTHPLASQLLQ